MFISKSCKCRKEFFTPKNIPDLSAVKSKKGMEWHEWQISYKPAFCENMSECPLSLEAISGILLFEKNDKGSQFYNYLIHRSRSHGRSSFRQAEGKTTRREFNKIAELQCFQCYFCLEKLSDHPDWYDPDERGGIAHWDHLTPVAKGGTNYPSNMAFVCKSCNLSKGAKTESEFWKYRKKLGFGKVNKKAQDLHKSYANIKKCMDR